MQFKNQLVDYFLYMAIGGLERLFGGQPFWWISGHKGKQYIIAVASSGSHHYFYRETEQDILSVSGNKDLAKLIQKVEMIKHQWWSDITNGRKSKGEKSDSGLAKAVLDLYPIIQRAHVGRMVYVNVRWEFSIKFEINLRSYPKFPVQMFLPPN